MAEFRNGELFAYVRGDSRRMAILGVAAEMREAADGIRYVFSDEERHDRDIWRPRLKDWIDRLVHASDDLSLELGQVKCETGEGKYRCWYSTGDTAACTPETCMVKFENSGWSHVERGGEDDLCEPVLGENWCGCTAFVCSKCGERVDESAGWHFCPHCGRHMR